MYEKLYLDLLLRYNELEHENKRLSEENLQLRRQLVFSEIPEENIEIPVITAASVNKYSSSKEKIDLFRSLFCAREDVFARRWQSTTSGRSGYQPVSLRLGGKASLRMCISQCHLLLYRNGNYVHQGRKAVSYP